MLFVLVIGAELKKATVGRARALEKESLRTANDSAGTEL